MKNVTSIGAALLALGVGALPPLTAFAGSGYCSGIPGSVEFTSCLSQEIAAEFLERTTDNPQKADSQIGMSLAATSEAAGSVMGTVARKYFPSMSFTTQTASKCTNYNVGAQSGPDRVDVDKSSCLQTGVVVGQSDSGVTIYACYAYHDQPVIRTGLICHAGTALPLDATGQNAAIIGGAVANSGVEICNEAKATHSNLASRRGPNWTGFENYNSLTICASTSD